MPTKIINRACLLAIAALTLSALLLQPRPDILSADSSDWHAAPQSYHLHWSIHAFSVLDTFHLADMVAHVKLKSIRAEARQEDWGSNYYPETEGSTHYFPEIWFEFEVVEYFKGSGSDTIWGIVAVHGGHGGQITASAIAAREVATRFIRHHIDPLHTGEAVVFMKDYYHAAPRTQQPNHYFLGSFLSFENYSVAANRRWLPLASSDSDSGASEEPQFMLKHPDGNIGGRYPEEELGTVGSPDNSVITLSELRHIAKNGRSLTEQKVRNRVNNQVRKAAQNLTAEMTGDAIVLRWNVNSVPSVLNAVTGYRVLRQSLQDDDETPFYTYYVDDSYLGFLLLRYPDFNMTELADVSPAYTSMSYEDKSDISPGTKYVYLVRPLDPYGTDAYVMITATNGATATGTVLPGVKFPTVTPTPTPIPTLTPTPGVSAASQ